MIVRGTTFVLFFFLFMLPGCTSELPGEEVSTGKETVVHINARTSISSVSEVTITSMRLIVMDKNSTEIFYNKSISQGLPEEVGTMRYAIKLKPGSYTICAVANETPEMTTSLDRAENLSALRKVTVQKDFGQDNITLFCQQDFLLKATGEQPSLQVLVSTDEGQSWENDLNLELTRTYNMVSLWLRKRTNSTDELTIQRVELCQYPEYSYLLPQPQTFASLPVRTLYDNAVGLPLGPDVPEGEEEYDTYQMIVNTSNIFPETLLENPSDPSKAVYLKIYARYQSLQTTYVFRLRRDLSVDDYNIPRNTHLKVYATIRGQGEASAIYLSPAWTTEEVPGNIPAPYLNVSETVVSLPYQIYVDANGNIFEKDNQGNYILPRDFDFTYFFWTNRPADSVSIEPFTLDSDPDIPVGIQSSLQILKDNGMHDLYDVAGRIDVRITSEDIRRGVLKSYSMTLRTDKLVRRLSFKVVSFVNVPQVIIPVIYNP